MFYGKISSKIYGKLGGEFRCWRSAAEAAEEEAITATTGVTCRME
jgi:hypothetical protein